MAEDDALEDAIEGGDDGEDMDPLAEEMLKMMEEEGDGEEGEILFHSDPFMCMCNMLRQRKRAAYPPCP